VCSKLVRLSIAQVNTVISQTQKKELRAAFKGKKYLPLDLRVKKTRAIRKRLTRHEVSRRGRQTFSKVPAYIRLPINSVGFFKIMRFCWPHMGKGPILNILSASKRVTHNAVGFLNSECPRDTLGPAFADH
jgi:hypothetical protein